jgi:hypothetical protein
MAVAAELFVNAHRYTHHPNIEIIDQSKVGAYSPETFFCTTLTEDGQSTYNTSTRLSTILAEAEGTSTDGKWSSLIHLFALANVLGRNINSIYPSHNAALRPLFNSIIRPHSTPSASLPPINILWSRTSLDERRGAVFEPNHFVPIIVSDYECQHNEPTFDDDGINYAEIDINNSKDPVIASVAGAYAVLNEDYTTDDDRPLSHFVQLKPSKKTAQTTARERTQISQKTTRIAVQDITQNDCIDHELEMYDTFNTSEVAYDVDNSDIEIGDIETDSEGSDDTDEERAEEEEPTIKWQKVHKKMQQRPFLGLTPGPVDGKLPENGRELDFFHLIFPEHLWPTITKSTNKYAPFYEAMKKNTEKEDKRKHSFNEVTEDEIKAYVGIRMIMALSNHPSQTDYWSTHPALNNAYIAGIMPRYRYEQIKRLFHIADPETDPTRIKNTKLRKEESEKNPMYKVGDLLEEVRQRSMAMYNLNCEVSVDEAMIKFHGQHFGSVGAPNKPCKRGFKVFVLADAHEGYLYNYIVYLRKKRETGLTQRIVEDLMANLVGRHHIVFVDKFYTSIDLALSLLNKGTYINGSFNTSRVKWPLDLKPNKRLRKKNDPIRSLERGESQARQTNDGKLMACCWKDSALVCNLSTCHSGVPDEVTDTVLRKIRTEGHWQKSELVCPPSIKEFNKYMGGVDRHDHLRSSYTLQRSSSKWWLYFVWFAFDVALVNAYLLWKTNNPKTTHKAFQLKVSDPIIPTDLSEHTTLLFIILTLSKLYMRPR